MTMKKFISLLLCVAMLLSVMTTGFAADTEENPTHRNVFLHALGHNPKETVDVSTVYTGETTELYFAVDNPNKGKYDGKEHLEPQYDMNGYTVKFYFDPAFFAFAENPSAPIDYKVPDRNLGDSNASGGSQGSSGAQVGYFPYKHGSGSASINGKTYKTAYATIFFSGEFVPQKTEEGWYNICMLPLTPLKTGNTDVFIDVEGRDEYTLELFAKNVGDDPGDQTFDFNARNAGYHHIIIKDKNKPSSPTATPNSGSYTEKQFVTLEAEKNCNIFYSTDGKNFEPYTGPIEVERTMDIYCYAVRTTDNKQSNTVTFNYKIVPKSPILYDASENKIPNINSSYTDFEVYASHEEEFVEIDDDKNIYYTYATNLSTDDIAGGTDPDKEWVAVTKNTQLIEVDKNCTMQLVTKNELTGEISEVSVYYFGIKPATVESNYPSAEYDSKIDVELSVETEDAQIFYTTDGSDPKTNGMEYTFPITLNKDTTIRAVAYYDGIYGDVSSFYYLFSYHDDFGVEAFYPSGVYEGSVNVTFTPVTPENKVMYSTDGGKTWKEFTEVLEIDRETNIIAKAIDPEGNEGDEYYFTYKIKPLPPEFAPKSTQFTNSDKITIYCTESNADNHERYTLYYTLDGTDPTVSGTRIEVKDDYDMVTINISGYTVVSAAVLKDDETYSSVVTHSYDIVTKKPIKPLTTLTPGNYTVEVNDPQSYSTMFMPVPEGTKIYYTVDYKGDFCPDPVPGDDSFTKEYKGEAIKVEGNTVIKAVAVNIFGVKSDIGIFDYTVSPQAPVAAPSATINSHKLPTVPVKAVPGSKVTYEVDGNENSFVTKDGVFYIDMSTGNAYSDLECNDMLGDDIGSDVSSPAGLVIKSELNGVSSDENYYSYAITDKAVLAPPYADMPMGTYPEIDSDGKNNFLTVKLYSINEGDTIQYRLDNEGDWEDYDGSGVELNKDTIIQLRAVKDDTASAIVSYVYSFVPLAPVITLPSGSYSKTPVPTTELRTDDRAPDNVRYTIWYRENGDKLDYRYTGGEMEIEHTMSLKAYVLNEKTGKVSPNTIHYYIVESEKVSQGNVYVASPFDVERIAASDLTKRPYSDGIKLLSQNKDAEIHYFYTYTRVDGTGATTNNYEYDNGAPIIVNALMDNISITAWLEKDGERIPDSEETFYIDFVHLEIPEPSLEATGEDEFKKNTKYTIINDYPDDETIFIYYTTDGSNPTDDENKKRILYDGEELSLKEDITLRCAYYSVCGKCVECKDNNFEHCWNPIYSEIGKYKYSVKSSSGGGGGGGGGNTVIDKTRKYTVDMFGFEHPTHIGYIKGYTDGSVRPTGDITREEMAAILYRVKKRAYDEPFEVTGKVFPDVTPERWAVLEIEFMTNDGVISGYPNGTFGPENKLTRAEFASLIYRFVGLEYKGQESVFSDVSEDHWAHNYILALYETGLVAGYGDGTFGPENNITRAEVMTVMNKILGRKPYPAYIKTLDYNPFNDLISSKWYYVDVIEATITHDYYLNDQGTYEIKWEDVK